MKYIINIAQILVDLEREMRQRRGKTRAGTLLPLPPNVDATSVPFKRVDSDTSTLTLAGAANAKLAHALVGSDNAVVTASDSSGLEYSSDQSQTVCGSSMHPMYSVRALTLKDITVHPGNDLTKGALDYLLSSLDRQDEDPDRFNFHISPAIFIHDLTEDDYTST